MFFQLLFIGGLYLYLKSRAEEKRLRGGRRV